MVMMVCICQDCSLFPSISLPLSFFLSLFISSYKTNEKVAEKWMNEVEVCLPPESASYIAIENGGTNFFFLCLRRNGKQWTSLFGFYEVVMHEDRLDSSIVRANMVCVCVPRGFSIIISWWYLLRICKIFGQKIPEAIVEFARFYECIRRISFQRPRSMNFIETPDDIWYTNMIHVNPWQKIK